MSIGSAGWDPMSAVNQFQDQKFSQVQSELSQLNNQKAKDGEGPTSNQTIEVKVIPPESDGKINILA